MPANNTSSSKDRIAREPQDCGRILTEALHAGDLDTCVALYEAGAVLFKKSGEPMSGLEAIRTANAALIAIKPRFTIEFIKSTPNESGDLATTRMKATLSGTKPDGCAVQDTVHTLEVVRKQADGSWRYVIDDPYGSMREGMKELQR
jgi:ketosteroid isomerase-like protein